MFVGMWAALLIGLMRKFVTTRYWKPEKQNRISVACDFFLLLSSFTSHCHLSLQQMLKPTFSRLIFWKRHHEQEGKKFTGLENFWKKKKNQASKRHKIWGWRNCNTNTVVSFTGPLSEREYRLSLLNPQDEDILKQMKKPLFV